MKLILDEGKREAICGIVAVGGSLQLAAAYAECTRQTIRRTANREPAFAKKLRDARVNPELFFLNTIRNAAKDPKYWPAAKWALQHMYPDRYARKPWTMSLAEVKELVRQLIDAIAGAIPERKVRAEVRRRIYALTGKTLRKAKEKCRK